LSKVLERHLSTLGSLRGPMLMPRAQSALGIGVDQEDRTVADTFRFDCEVGAKHGLSTAAFLGVHHNCLHAVMLPGLHANNIAMIRVYMFA
jgi:hypothetical protein